MHDDDSLLPSEKRSVFGLSAIFALRMLGLFLVLPVFSIYADQIKGATPFLIGMALGGYGLTQALLQVPFGTLSDKFGRKPIIVIGLLIFVAGSVLAAEARTIGWLLVGRLLQGMGAINSTVVAMVADLTRENVRTRGMASIGVSIGLAFSIGIIIGPMISSRYGVPMLFWLTAVAAALAIPFLLFGVPTPRQTSHHRDAEITLDQVMGVLKNRNLQKLNGGMFIVQASLTSVFLVVPFLLKTHLDEAHVWKVYAPMTLLGIMIMIPTTIIAEKHGKMKEIMFLGMGLMACGFLGFLIFPGLFWMTIVALFVYFAGFNIMEPIMPSLTSKFSNPANRGTAMGFFNMSQSIGASAGGAIGGMLLNHSHAAIYLTMIGLILAWAVVTARMQMPAKRVPVSAPLPNGGKDS